MRLLRPLVFLLATIYMVAPTAFGRVKPQPIDAESLLLEYFHILESNNPEEEINKWISSKSEIELAAIPIVVGNGLINQIEGNALTDSSHYNAYLSAIGLIEKGVEAIEKSGAYDALYLYISDDGLVPVRYILANAYDKAYKYVKADSAYVLTAQEIGRDFGVDSDEFVFWTNQAATAINERYKNYEKALELMRPAVDAALNSGKVSKSTSFDFLIAYAQKNYRAGHYDEALKHSLEAFPRAEGNVQIYQVNRLIGNLYSSAGKFTEAETYFATASQNSPGLAEFLANSYDYSTLLKNMGCLSEAVLLLKELDKYIASEELSDEDRFNYYENLGVATTFAAPEESKVAFNNAERYNNSVGYDVLIRHIINSQIYPNEGNSFLQISALDRIMFIYHNFVKNEPRLLAEILYLFGDYYLKIRDYDKARNYLVEAFGCTLDFSESDPFTIRILKDLCTLYKTTGQDGLWKVSIDELIPTAEPLGRNSERYLNAVASALDYCFSTNNLSEAEEYLSLYIQHRPDDFDANCYKIKHAIALRQFDKAKELLAQLEDTKSDDDPDLSQLWESLYVGMRHPDVAIYARRNFESYRNEILQQLLFMSSDERNNLKEELTRRRDEAIDMIDITPDMIDIAFDYSLLIKGLLLNTQSKIRKYLSSTPKAVEDWNKLQELRKELNRAEAQGNEPACGNIRSEIASRERYILNDFVDYDLFKKSFDTRSIANIKKNRPENSVLIDFVKFHDSPATYYVAFVVDTNGTSHFVPISRAWELEDMPSEAWIKLEELLKGSKSVYFCPDDRLSSLPLEYQCDENEIPYSNRFKIHRVFHLAELPTEQSIGNTPVAIGISDHNSPIGQADVIYRGNWTDMPNVKTEIAQFQQILNKKHPTILYNDQATEERLKSLNGSNVSVLHISTHGFYRNNDSLLIASADERHPDFNVAKRALTVGKMELSGLVLRGGNVSWKSPEINDKEDNLLTSDEIEQMSFPNLNLVVLSACNTGLGNTDSDGVWGLQRAFRIAGCKSLICSLNKVDDYWTAQFMEELYKNASNGMTIYDSFHSAHKTLWETPECPRELLTSFILIE